MILYESDHKTKASNLASKLNEQSADIATYTGSGGNIPICKDATLTIWGHGGPDTFAGLAPDDLKVLISNWKARNPQLTTVDIVTCDARHVQNDRDSYTDKLMPLLISNGKLLVKIRTLPRGGSNATWSELWAYDAVNVDGYYFVAGDTQDAMKAGVDVLHIAEHQVPDGTKPENRFMAAFPLAKAMNDKLAMKSPLSYVSMGGSLTQLRDQLVTVTTYVKDGKILAIPSTTKLTQLPTLNNMLATASTPKSPKTKRTHFLTLKDMVTITSKHPLALHALAAQADAPPPDSLFDMLHKDKQAPSSTVVAAVSDADVTSYSQQLQDVMMLTSFISVAAARYLYQTTYKDRKPDITTPAGASEFVKAMANAKNYILSSSMAGYLSSESLLAREFHQSTTSADLHMDFLTSLFDGFNFPKSTITELDSVLTSITKNISDLKLSWSDQNSTLDHMVFLYYFDAVMGLDNVKVPKVRIYFLHIDQASWTVAIGKSSMANFEFNMNFSDGIYTMDVNQTASDRNRIQSMLTSMSGQSIDELNKLLSPAVVNPNPN